MLVGMELCFGGRSWAGGLNFPTNGTMSLARGGANVAKVADPTAIVNNPAGLAGLSGFRLVFDNDLTHQHLCFQRGGTYPGTPGPGTYAGQPFPRVCRMNKGMFYIPMLSASYGWRDWTFALGGYGPHAVGRRNFSRQVTVHDSMGLPVRAPGPTRYDVLSQDVLVIFFTAAAAWRAADWLDIGFAIQPTFTEMRFGMNVPLNPSNLDPDSDVYFAIHNKGFALTGLLGAKIRPWKHLEIGLSVRLPVSSKTKGTATIHLPPSLIDLGGPVLHFHKGSQVTMSSSLPLYLRFGVRYRWLTGPKSDSVEIADLEADVQWERWSSMRALDTVVHADMIGDDLGVFRLPHFYQDTISLRLGSTFTIPRSIGGGRLSFSAGLFYDSAASPLEYTRLDYQAFSLLGFGLGAAFTIRGIQIQLAVSHAVGGVGWPWEFHLKRRVDRSCIQPVDPFNPPDLVRCDPYGNGYDASKDIGRGTYESSYTTVSLGFQIMFDELLRRTPTR